jgi:hypothetical protein
MGPLEKEVAELLNESMRDTPFGLAVRVQGVEAAVDTLLALSEKQRAKLLLELFTGIANAIRRTARGVDEANLSALDERKDRPSPGSGS